MAAATRFSLGKPQLTAYGAQLVADACRDAYSFDRYGATAWRASAVWLASRGLDAAEVECVLRSKWMRWAADQFESRTGVIPANALSRWVARDTGDAVLALRTMMEGR